MRPRRSAGRARIRRIGRPWCGFADELAPSLGSDTRRTRAAAAAALDRHGRFDLRPRRRGEFLVDEIALRVEGPLGLVARQRTRHVPMSIKVFPSFRSKDEAELRINKARILDVGLRSAKGRGGGTEFDQLREYTVDDDFRRVDWAATARSGRPIVRTYRAERNQTVINLLDNGRVMAGTVDGVARVEHAMDAVMTLTTVATRLGDRCGLLAFDQECERSCRRRTRDGQLGRVVEAMFDLEPVFAESDYRSAFNETLVRFRRRAMLRHLHRPRRAGHGRIVAAGDRTHRSQPRRCDRRGAGSRRRVVGHGPVLTEEDSIARSRHCAPSKSGGAPSAVCRVGRHRHRRPTGQLPADLADAYLRVKATGRL